MRKDPKEIIARADTEVRKAEQALLLNAEPVRVLITLLVGLTRVIVDAAEADL